MKQHNDELIEQGFCRVPDILPADLRKRLAAATDALVARQTEEQAARLRSQGSMFPVMSDPVFAELIALPLERECLALVGCALPTFSDGYVISKPGHSPRLFRHYDWFAWEDARSYEPAPPQVFLMYYLTEGVTTDYEIHYGASRHALFPAMNCRSDRGSPPSRIRCFESAKADFPFQRGA